MSNTNNIAQLNSQLSVAPLPGQTTTMLSPDGQIGEIPTERVNDAVKSGFKVGVNLISSDGKRGTVPMDRAHDALASGLKLDTGNHAISPTPAMVQQKKIADALNPDNATSLPGVGVGIAKGALDTMRGAANIVGGEGTAERVGLPNVNTAASNTSQSIGKGLEDIGEFGVGEGEVKGLTQMAGIPERVLALAEKYPKTAKLLHAAVKAGEGAIVGGAQGAAKADEGNRAEGAESGALGGGIGGAIGGGIESIPLRGNPAENLVRAVRPTGRLAEGFTEQAELALPRLAAEHKATPITNLDELSDAAHTAAKKLWNTEIIPQIQRHAAETIPGQPVAAAIRGGVSAGDKDLFAGAADAAEDFAKKFDHNMTLQQASDRLQSLNKKLSSLYKLDPASRYAATANSPTIEAMEDGANELRQQIYTKLKSLGEADPAGQRATYGALKDVERAAEKRAIVHGRQNPINLSQVLATAGGVGEAAGALLSGHPLAALAGGAPMVVANIAKRLNSPEYLVKAALEDEGLLPKIFTKVPPSSAVANVGSQVGQASGPQQPK